MAQRASVMHLFARGIDFVRIQVLLNNLERELGARFRMLNEEYARRCPLTEDAFGSQLEVIAVEQLAGGLDPFPVERAFFSRNLLGTEVRRGVPDKTGGSGLRGVGHQSSSGTEHGVYGRSSK